MSDAGSDNNDKQINSGENENINIDGDNTDKYKENDIVVDNSDKKEKVKQRETDKFKQ